MRRLKMLLMFCLTTSLVFWSDAFSSFAGSPWIQSEPASNSPQSISWHDPNFAVGWIISTSNSGGYGMIYKTMDGGRNWIRQGSPSEIPEAPLYGVYASDARNVWVVGGNVDGYGLILRTSNGGATWVRQGSAAQIPDVELSRVYAIDDQTAWASGNQGVMLFTDDAGQTWNRKGQGTLPEALLQGIYASDANHVWVVGAKDTDYGLIFHTSDGGNNWEEQKRITGHWMISIHGVDSNTAWAVGNETTLYTSDGGQTWQDRTRDPTPWGDVNGVFAFDQERVWATEDFDGIYLSINGGVDWVKQTSSTSGFYLIRISPINNQSAWVIGPTENPRPDPGDPLGTILRTTDGGENWEAQHAPTDESWSGVAFVPMWTYYYPWVVKNSP